MRKCRFCQEEIQDASRVCEHCGKDLFPNRAPVVVPVPAPVLPLKTIEERREILSRTIATQVMPSMRVESRADDQVVLLFGSKPNHLLHFVIGIFTLGLWWIVWLVIAATTRETHRLITVDEFGSVSSRDY